MRNLTNIVMAIFTMGILAACTNADINTGAESSAAEQVITMTDESIALDEAEEPMDKAEEAMGMNEDIKPVTMDDADEPMSVEEGEESMTEDVEAVHDETMMEEKDEVTKAADTVMDDQETADHEDSMSGDGEAMEDMSEMPADESESMAETMALPAWQQAVLTNARTLETFTLADFADKKVFVEPMATWCTNCRHQLNNVREARTQLVGDDTIFVALSLETNISADMLAQYADGQGFDWLFAVMTPEVLQELVNTFGRSVTSAPSTPHFIIRPDGSFTDLTTGIESPEQILQQLQAASG